MANVNIKFNGKDYLLSCDDGQEESLKKLTSFLDKKYLELKKKLGNIGENKLLLITAIKLIDEHFDLRRRVKDQKDKLDGLSKKFIELKSLAIKYKDVKEVENKYNLLASEHENLQQKLDHINTQKKNEQKKEIEFSEKIDELNQETDSLLEEIDKWQM